MRLPLSLPSSPLFPFLCLFFPSPIFLLPPLSVSLISPLLCTIYSSNFLHPSIYQPLLISTTQIVNTMVIKLMN